MIDKLSQPTHRADDRRNAAGRHFRITDNAAFALRGMQQRYILGITWRVSRSLSIGPNHVVWGTAGSAYRL